jgi:hypothetical protein
VSPATKREVDGGIKQEVKPEEGLVTSLAIEEYGDVEISCKFEQLPVRVDTGGMEGLVHMPEHEVELPEQPRSSGLIS